MVILEKKKGKRRDTGRRRKEVRRMRKERMRILHLKTKGIIK
jgi:hypothetical protein